MAQNENKILLHACCAICSGYPISFLKEMGYHRNMVSMQGLGYKEILDFLDGKCTLEEAIYIIKRETRH